jgi:hypothetical protein
MTKYQSGILASLATETVLRLDNLKIPEDWGELEIRWLLADAFDAQREYNPTLVKRRRKYTSWMRERGLL